MQIITIIMFVLIIIATIRDTIYYIRTSKGSELVLIELLSICVIIIAIIMGRIK